MEPSGLVEAVGHRQAETGCVGGLGPDALHILMVKGPQGLKDVTGVLLRIIGRTDGLRRETGKKFT